MVRAVRDTSPADSGNPREDSGSGAAGGAGGPGRAFGASQFT